MRTARRAGIRHATQATTKSRSGPAENATVSSGVTPNRALAIARVAKVAVTTPTAKPITVVVKAVGAYLVFTVLTSGVLRVSLADPRTVPVIVLLLGIPAGLLCRRRVRQARLVSLTFEDELPTDVTVLGLNAD